MKKRLMIVVASLVAMLALAGVSQAAILEGTWKADTIQGTSGDDVIIGRGGNDQIAGGGGADFIRGQGGADTIKVYSPSVELPNGTFVDDGNDAVRCGEEIDYVLAGKKDRVSKKTCEYISRRP